MSFPMQAVQFPHGGWPEGVDAPAGGAGQTYPRGTPVTFAAGVVDEHALAATVTNILGVSHEGVTVGVADNPSGMIAVARATRSNVFCSKLVNAGGAVQVPDIANVGVSYGLLKIGAGRAAWFAVDEDDVANVVVQVIGFDSDRDIVFFKFLETAIQSI